jgi:predicted aspartyl protease
MIPGIVNNDGLPCILLTLAGQDWLTIIDTGFNGGVELPLELKGEFNDQPFGEITAQLGGNKRIVEDSFLVDFPFDGELVPTIATYVEGKEILLGTLLLQSYSLTIHFARREVYLQRDE